MYTNFIKFVTLHRTVRFLFVSLRWTWWATCGLTVRLDVCGINNYSQRQRQFLIFAEGKTSLIRSIASLA